MKHLPLVIATALLCASFAPLPYERRREGFVDLTNSDELSKVIASLQLVLQKRQNAEDGLACGVSTCKSQILPVMNAISLATYLKEQGNQL
jgi:hypothetical protein